MKRRKLMLGLLVLGLLCGGPVRANWEVSLVQQAIEVLDQSTRVPEKGIPAALIQNAQGVLIMPDVVKAGFVIGGRHGHGVLLVRAPDGGWSNPIFVNLTGGSFGWQAGVQSADLVLVFTTAQGVQRLLRGRGKMTLGVDASVAAGPVGRQASAATDLLLRSEIYSYSRSRGLFLGLALEGDSVRVAWPANEHFYGRPMVSPSEILNGAGLAVPQVAGALRTVLTALTVPQVQGNPEPPVPVGNAPVPPPPLAVPMSPPR